MAAQTTGRTRYEVYMDQGKCVRCGKANDNLPVCSCKSCNEAKKEYSRTTYKKRREERISAGLCVQCGNKPASIRRRCKACANKVRQTVKNRTLQREKQGCCKGCGKEIDRIGKACCACLDRKLAIKRKQRIDVLQYYGGKCTRCGNNDERVLCLDHINDDGAEHRKEHGNNMVRWAVRNGYPSGVLQVLCHNCNWIKKREYEEAKIKQDRETRNQIKEQQRRETYCRTCQDRNPRA